MKNILLIVTLTILTSYFSLLSAKNEKLNKLIEKAKQESPPMSLKKLKDLIDREKSVILLDIRENDQKGDGQIYADESYAITRGNLEFVIEDEIENKNSIIVTYCRNGGRSVLAAQSLRKLGYKNATSLKGGMQAWAIAGYPIETGLGVTFLKKAAE